MKKNPKSVLISMSLAPHIAIFLGIQLFFCISLDIQSNVAIMSDSNAHLFGYAPNRP